MMYEPNFDCPTLLLTKLSSGEKPKYRIQWDYEQGIIVGFWLWTCNFEAISLQPSKYYKL